MKIKRASFILFSLGIAVTSSIHISSCLLSQPLTSNLNQTVEPKNMRMQSQGNIEHIIVVSEPLELQAWQEDPTLPPVGVPYSKDRPISYAMWSVTFENKTEQTIFVKIKTVDIYLKNSDQPFISLSSQELVLRPLEIAPQQYHFSSQISYSDVRQIEALMTYQIDNQTYTLQSPLVDIR